MGRIAFKRGERKEGTKIKKRFFAVAGDDNSANPATSALKRRYNTCRLGSGNEFGFGCPDFVRSEKNVDNGLRR